MFVYNVGLKSKKTNMIYNDEICVNCVSNRQARKLIYHTFDNLVSYKFLYELPIKYSEKTFKIFTPTVNYFDLIYDYVKDSKFVYLEELKDKLGFVDIIPYGKVLRKIGYRYNKANERYELKY